MTTTGTPVLSQSLQLSPGVTSFFDVCFQIVPPLALALPLALRRRQSQVQIKEEGWARGQHPLPGNTIARETSTRENQNIPALAEDGPRKRSNNRRPGLMKRSGNTAYCTNNEVLIS